MRYAFTMRQRRLIYRLRAHLAAILGMKSEDAITGKWWEVDLIIVILGGAFALGIAAIIQL